jgi:hypothetical protein
VELASLGAMMRLSRYAHQSTRRDALIVERYSWWNGSLFAANCQGENNDVHAWASTFNLQRLCILTKLSSFYEVSPI